MSDAAILGFVLLATLIAAVVIPHLMLKAAIPEVLKRFRERGALTKARAVSAEELGLVQQSIWERALRRRDYKPKALMGLIQLDVVKIDDDGNLYLSEEALAESVFKDM